jgi:hypothetical protein
MTQEDKQDILNIATQEGLYAEYSWTEDCVFVDMQWGIDEEESERIPVYSLAEMLDILG